MFARLIGIFVTFLLLAAPAEARRVALIIGQDAYPGGASATIGFSPLHNGRNDAHRIAGLLGQHGFEIISCDGKKAGCFDLDAKSMMNALDRLESMASGADLALVFFAGHGLASDEGNILAPINAKVNCSTGSIVNGIPVEFLLKATQSARHKLLIIDACRDNPIDIVCPALSGKKLSFARIETGSARGLLLVSSTQFGQQALDGLAGQQSPFAKALVSALEANPNVYFEQVMNEVARSTYESAQKHSGFLQIPGKVVGGDAPADCLAGKHCVGDVRLSALFVENERLAAEGNRTRIDAKGVQQLRKEEELARGRPYGADEWASRLREIETVLRLASTSSEPKRQEAAHKLAAGDVTAARDLLKHALQLDREARVEAERQAMSRRVAIARAARDLAILTQETNLREAIEYYQEAVDADPTHAETWLSLAQISVRSGLLDQAAAAFEQAYNQAGKRNGLRTMLWAMLGLGEISTTRRDPNQAREYFAAAIRIVDPISAITGKKLDPESLQWQRERTLPYIRMGDLHVSQGFSREAKEYYASATEIIAQIISVIPPNAGWQHELAMSYERTGSALLDSGRPDEALNFFDSVLVIATELAETYPTNSLFKHDLMVAHVKIGDATRQLGKMEFALQNYKSALVLADKLIEIDRNDAQLLHQLSELYRLIGTTLVSMDQPQVGIASLAASASAIERLLKINPNEMQWRMDEAVLHKAIGNAKMRANRLSEARDSFALSIRLLVRLMESRPQDAIIKEELAASYGKLGQLFEKLDDKTEALRSYRLGRDLILPLAQRGGPQSWSTSLAAFDDAIRKLDAR
jgi:tetratricopeptide (TPR) repeat protein